MNQQQLERWEAQIQETARELPFPPTPDLASAVTRRASAAPAPRRRLVMMAVVAALVLLGLLAVPPVRARIIEVLRIGAVRILPAEPTPLPSLPAPAPAPAASRPTATPRPTPTVSRSLLDLAGETTLADAQQQVAFPIRLPTLPANLGPPDKVFLQDLRGAVVILAWLEPDQPDRVRLSLHQFGPNTFAEKIAPRVVRRTTVNGAPAAWTVGPHILRVQAANGFDFQERRLVNGHVLIWMEGDVTYRLETNLELEEAVRVAESLS